jgi:hypothetical protein
MAAAVVAALAFPLAAIGAGRVLAQAAQAPAPKSPGQPSATPGNDLDAFMARVLERRDEAWRKLHDYVLDETEQFRILGPGGVPLDGRKREFTWYVREGFLIRSPVRYGGVVLNEEERRKYERRWMQQEKEREAKAAERAARGKAAAPRTASQPAASGAAPTRAEADASLQEFVDQRGEPRFISEAYFLQFKFEPGNYYFAGRDTIDGRPIVKIEYYPTRLFADDDEKGDEAAGTNAAAKDAAAKKPGASAKTGRAGGQGEKDPGEDFERKFNKVALVTLWIDPAEYQIVRYTFDNIDFGFLPGRWLVRVDQIRASMTMAREFEGVWLPREIDMRGGLSLATGGYEFEYSRRFSGYKKAETGARIRSIAPKDQQ